MSLIKAVFLFCAAVLLYSGSLFYPRWQKAGTEAQISWDAGGYYWYLPSVFIYHDLKKQDFKDSVLRQYYPIPPEDFQYGYKHPSGNYVIRYTIGTAILEAPFFGIAHLAAKPLGYPADGFSRPYQFMIYLGGILFTLLGLWYLQKLLRCYYSEKITALLLLLLVLGTNYLNYAGIDVGMTHSWLFTLYVLILWHTHLYYQDFRRKYALRLGILIGITALVRPPEIISVLIPLLWGMERLSVTAIRERLVLLRKLLPQLVPATLICCFILSFQFLYWKYATGDWFVYTYQKQGFSWLKPNIKQYALNFQCGWLIYTPLMFLALAGIIPFIKKGRNKVAILAVIAVNYYIVAAWDAWDYGGRAMVQNYSLLLFPLASLLTFVARYNWLKLLAAPVLLLFCYFNLWWTYQAHKGTLIGSVPATSAYFFATALRYEAPLELQTLRDNEDLYRNPVKNPKTLYTNELKDSAAVTIVNDQQASFSFPVRNDGYQWLRASADIHIDQKEWNVWFMTQFIIRLKKGNDVVRENSIRVQRLLNDGETKTINIDLKVRHKDFDQVELLFRNDNNGTLPARVHKLKVIGFKE